MITETLQNVTLRVEREEGVNIDGTKMSGTGLYDAENNSFEFNKTPKRVKSAPKNTIIYAGDHMNMRLQQSGAYRATIMIPANTKIEELQGHLVAELVECLQTIR
mgnify:CR=1 FL=1